jgi:3-hydroxyisobutyrate dehydrogenase-like beta-hydroxyacid dehydrogenase
MHHASDHLLPPVREIGFIGLGLMGSALSARLLAAGHRIVGFDLDPDRLSDLAGRGGTPVASVAEVTAPCRLLVLSLPDSDIVRRVCLGKDGIAATAAPGTVVIDTTTSRPGDVEEVAGRLAARSIGFVDATLSGNATQARHGDLVAMAGGSAEDVARAGEILAVVARSVHHMGPVGSGARTKLLVNLVLGVHRLVLAEGLVMGEKAGVDPALLLEVLRDGAAASRAMDIWGPRMVTGDHLPPASRIRQSHKDFRLIVELGMETGAPAWLASITRQLLAVGEADGLGELDNSGVIEILRRMAGIGRHPPPPEDPRPSPAATDPGVTS